jgi:hypothetical protein
MTARANDNRVGGIYGKSCRVRLDDWFGRFGASGPYAVAEWARNGLEQTWARPGAGAGQELDEKFSHAGLRRAARALGLPRFRHLNRSLIVPARRREG